MEAELRPALNHLGNAELWPLRRMQRHEHRAEQIAEQDRQNRPGQRQAEYGAKRAGHDRRDLHVGAEPDGEEAVDRAVALTGGDMIDAMPLDGETELFEALFFLLGCRHASCSCRS
jgi:hypothetical protein